MILNTLNMSKFKSKIGNLLISNPSNPQDELDKSVILLVTHTDSLAIGLQVNRIQPESSLAIVSQNLGIPYYGPDPIFYGGNVAVNKIHIVHTLDWRGMGTVPISKYLGVTNDISILAAIEQNQGPRYYKACAGYWIWEDSRLDQQLESKFRTEAEPHKWELTQATIQNVFELDSDIMWGICLEQSIKEKVDQFF